MEHRLDSHVPLKQELFPIVPEEPKSNLLTNLVFSGAAVLVFLAYLYFAESMDSNYGLFPQASFS